LVPAHKVGPASRGAGRENRHDDDPATFFGIAAHRPIVLVV
jgi:hypothetical protein